MLQESPWISAWHGNPAVTKLAPRSAPLGLYVTTSGEIGHCGKNPSCCRDFKIATQNSSLSTWEKYQDDSLFDKWKHCQGLILPMSRAWQSGVDAATWRKTSRWSRLGVDEPQLREALGDILKIIRSSCNNKNWNGIYCIFSALSLAGWLIAATLGLSGSLAKQKNCLSPRCFLSLNIFKKKRGLDSAPRPNCVVVLARCCCCNRLSTSFLPHSTQPFFCQSHLGKWALNNWKGKMVSQLRL